MSKSNNDKNKFEKDEENSQKKKIIKKPQTREDWDDEDLDEDALRFIKKWKK